jgi:ribosomal protein L18
MIKHFNANNARLRRHQRMRSHFEGTSTRPRLNVFRSGLHIYAQIIDDTTGKTVAAASSLDESLRDFKPAVSPQEKASGAPRAAEKAEAVEVTAEAAPVAKGRAAKAEKTQQKGPAKGGPVGKGGKPGTQVKTLLPQAVRGEKKTPVEALAPIAHNRKVATAREVGKLLAQRAKEKGVSRVVFDRGGYAYHGRVAALAEGAREVGLEF